MVLSRVVSWIQAFFKSFLTNPTVGILTMVVIIVAMDKLRDKFAGWLDMESSVGFDEGDALDVPLPSERTEWH